MILQTVLRPVNVRGFVVLPKRWIVERTFAWMNRLRRLSEDYERLTESSEAVMLHCDDRSKVKTTRTPPSGFLKHVLTTGDRVLPLFALAVFCKGRSACWRKMPCLTLLVLSVLLVPPLTGQESDRSRLDEETSSGPDYAASLLQALVLNNRSIDRYDVLCTREILTVNPDGEVSSFKSRLRLVHDRESKNWLEVCAVQMDDWTNDDEPKTSKRVFALLIAKGEKAYVRDVRGIREVSGSKLLKDPRKVGWPTFLTLGLERFPDTITDESSSNLFWERTLLGKRGLSSTMMPNGEITVKLAVDHVDQDSVDYRWVFDQSTMVPRIREVAVRLRDSGKRLVKERSRIEWEEMSGLYVPTSIRRSMLRRSDGAGASTYETTDDTDFEWKELGSDLNKSYFTIESFEKLKSDEFLSFSNSALSVSP